MRIFYIDFFRFLAIISMIIYHWLFDMKYIFSFDMPWFSIEKWYFFQQYICISFIFISGACTNLSKKLLKNTIVLFILSMTITVVTVLISEELAIYFGVLHLLFLCSLFYYIFKKFLDRLNPEFMFFLNIIIFVILKSGIFSKNQLYLYIYDILKNLKFGFVFGFYGENFASADYFPFFPWIFLFMAGHYFFKMNVFDINLFTYEKERYKMMGFASKNSLKIYMLHQFVLCGIIMLGIQTNKFFEKL